MIIALGRDREAEYKENLHKIANVSIAKAVNKGWDQTNAYDIIWCQLILCSAFMPDSGHFFVWCGIKWCIWLWQRYSKVNEYSKDEWGAVNNNPSHLLSSFKTFFLANHSTSYFLMRPSNKADIFGGKFACCEEEKNGLFCTIFDKFNCRYICYTYMYLRNSIKIKKFVLYRLY